MEEKYTKTKKIIMITMCTLICIMAVGYAAFATQLTINGTASIESTWKVEFTNIEEVSKTSGVTITNPPTASGTTATFNIDLTSPGDKIVYKITVANQGTLNAIIDDITASESGSDAIKFEVSGITKGVDIMSVKNVEADFCHYKSDRRWFAQTVVRNPIWKSVRMRKWCRLRKQQSLCRLLREKRKWKKWMDFYPLQLLGETIIGYNNILSIRRYITPKTSL